MDGRSFGSASSRFARVGVIRVKYEYIQDGNTETIQKPDISYDKASGQSSWRRTRRSAIAQDYLRQGDFTEGIH